MRPSARLPLRTIAGLLTAGLFVLLVVPSGASAASASDLTDKQTQARQIADKLDALNSKLMSLADRSEVARQSLEEATKGVDAERQRVDSANADIDRARGQLTSYAVGAYMSGNDSQSVDAILSSEPDHAPVKSGYVHALTGNRADLLDQLSSAKQRAAEEGARLQSKVDAAQAESDRIDAAQREADAAVAEQTKLKSQVDGELTGLLAAEQQRRDAATAQQAQLASQQASSKPRTPTAPTVTTPGTAGPVAPPPMAPPGPPPPTNGRGAKAVAAAMTKLGDKYVWAAAGPDTFDCSGLTLWAWAQAGVSLPHYTGSQLAVTQPIPISDLQPGDLVFIWGPGEGGGAPGHVGLYIGGGQMVHAPNSGSYVKVDSIYWWSGARVAAGRVR
jgi:cell wall-associated NlpC family hydrolase